MRSSRKLRTHFIIMCARAIVPPKVNKQTYSTICKSACESAMNQAISAKIRFINEVFAKFFFYFYYDICYLYFFYILTNSLSDGLSAVPITVRKKLLRNFLGVDSGFGNLFLTAPTPVGSALL